MFEKRMHIIRNYAQWYDISLIKISSMIFALLVAKYFDWFLRADWYWYILLLLLTSIRGIYLLYISKKEN
jgi:hypothetical protein